MICCSTEQKQDKKMTSDSIIVKDTQCAKIKDYPKIFDSYNVRYDYDWHGLSHLTTYYSDFNYSDISKILSKESHLFEVNPSVGYFVNHLKVVDLNGDSIGDIIYSGPTGGVASEVVFLIHDNKNYRKILTIEQGIVKVEWENNRIKKIFSHDWGCCASINLINTVYNFNYDSVNFPHIKKIFQSIEYERMEKPLVDTTFDFKVNGNVAALRFSPIIDDTSFFFGDRKIGNKIGIVKNGARGRVFGLKKTKSGDIWWYVIIVPTDVKVQNILYMKDLDFPTHVIGWLKRDDLIKI
jgi:hypothetical protein